MIQKIYLQNFRNFEDKLLEFSPSTTVVVGDNATGKTNILESIYLLSTGKSFKANVEREMIFWDAQITRVKGVVGSEEKQKLEVVLTRGEIVVSTEPLKKEKAPRKRLLVNGVGKRLVDFVGNFQTVLFSPEDMDLVTESPSGRRKFLDSVLIQTDREYRRSLLSYEKAVRQRNKLLLKIREDLPAGRQEGASRSQLAFWDKLLIKNGDYIERARSAFIDFINRTDSLHDRIFKIEYDKSVISEERLQEYSQKEIYAGKTLVGPHRDDFIFHIKKMKSDDAFRELAPFGSRGEQRMGVLWLKLAELSFIEDKIEKRPTLLLDDIFSELDHEHRDIVLDVVKKQQTIITTADPHFVEGLQSGQIIKI